MLTFKTPHRPPTPRPAVPPDTLSLRGFIISEACPSRFGHDCLPHLNWAGLTRSTNVPRETMGLTTDSLAWRLDGSPYPVSPLGVPSWLDRCFSPPGRHESRPPILWSCRNVDFWSSLPKRKSLFRSLGPSSPIDPGRPFGVLLFFLPYSFFPRLGAFDLGCCGPSFLPPFFPAVTINFPLPPFQGVCSIFNPPSTFYTRFSFFRHLRPFAYYRHVDSLHSWAVTSDGRENI